MLKAYKETLPDKAKPLNDVSIEDRQRAPREAASNDAHRKLEEIAAGAEHADLYHRTILGLLTEIFYPWLTHPVKEQPVDGGRKRIDIMFNNSADDGFFASFRGWSKFTRFFVPILP